jgi:hypothetical protein
VYGCVKVRHAGPFSRADSFEMRIRNEPMTHTQNEK